MANDPTKANRDAISGFIKSILPANSPFMNSGDNALTPGALAKIEAEKKIAEAAKAQAANPAPVVTPEAPIEFTNPNQPQEEAARTPAMNIIPQEGAVDIYKQGLYDEANVLGKVGNEQASAYGDLSNQQQKIDADIEAVRAKEQSAFEAFEKEDADTRKKIDNFEIEPKSFFAGKSTWQKILGGVGMFLGSITPEGARNVASIIEKEIDRDIDIQKQQFALLKDKRSDTANRYKMKVDRFGSDKLAMMSMKKDALMATELQLKKIEASAKGPLARSKATQGLAQLTMKSEEISMKMRTEYAKIQKDQSKGSVPGYNGIIEDPTSAREFRAMISEIPAVLSDLDTLLGINEKFLGGALSPSASATADSAALRLQGGLRVALLGPGTVNDSERKLLVDAISNPTRLFSLRGSNKIRIESLKKAYQSKVNANATALGLEKVMPQGARKLN
jgi:hypothetical protein